VIHREVVDDSALEAAERAQKSLRKACRASCRRSRCERRVAEWARRTEAAAERNELLARRVLLPLAPRSLQRDASPERAPGGRCARGGGQRNARLEQFLSARAARAVNLDLPLARAARAAAVAAAPEAPWWTVGDVALRAACVLVAVGLCPPQTNRLAMTRRVAEARLWRQRDVFVRELPCAPSPTDAAAAVATAKWFCCVLSGLSARKCGGRRVCARRFSPGVGIGGAKCQAKVECAYCVGDLAVRAACAMMAFGACPSAPCRATQDGAALGCVGGRCLVRAPRPRPRGGRGRGNRRARGEASLCDFQGEVLAERCGWPPWARRSAALRSRVPEPRGFRRLWDAGGALEF